ncbi:MAG: FtsQ-type POTRA domain-containing protein [Cryobacterium sp.]
MRRPDGPSRASASPAGKSAPTGGRDAAGGNTQPGAPDANPNANPDTGPMAPVTSLTRGAAASQTAQATFSAGAKLTGRAARAGLRAATRARKRYERDEVRRFTQRSRRRRTNWIISFGAVAAVTVGVVATAYSPVMALRSIEIVGTDRVPTPEIVAALDGQLGTPLPLLDADLIKSELSRFTLIQSFVTESRPPGTLVVRIVEREPVGTLATAKGFDLVDAAGVIIEQSDERPEGFPLIEADRGPSSPGFAAVAAVTAALPDSIRSQLDTISARTTDDVTLNLIGGARVVWGSAEQSEYKAVVLGALMISHPVGSVNEYDVTSPDSAVLR